MSAYLQYPDEVRADLQRYFGLNIEHMGHDFSIWQAAACLRCLPLGSNLLTKIDPQMGYTKEDYLLHGIRDALYRQHLPYPWEINRETSGQGTFDAVPVDEFDAWRKNTRWKEVEGQCRVV